MSTRNCLRNDPAPLAPERRAPPCVATVSGPRQVIFGGIQLVQEPLRNRLQAVGHEFCVESGGQRQVHLVHFIGFVNLVFVRLLETVNLQSLPLHWTLILRTSSNVRNNATILTR